MRGKWPFIPSGGGGGRQEGTGTMKTNNSKWSRSLGGGKALPAPSPHQHGSAPCSPPRVGETLGASTAVKVNTKASILLLFTIAFLRRNAIGAEWHFGHELLIAPLCRFPTVMEAFSWLPYIYDSRVLFLFYELQEREKCLERFKGPLRTEKCRCLPAEPSSLETIGLKLSVLHLPRTERIR